MKEIEKYIGYYLLVYLVVLFVCGFFQYMAVCQGKTLECTFSMNGINTIITTTAYVLTPIIAIIGFLSWRNQETYRKSQELIELIMDKTRELELTWHKSRNHGDISRFQEYCSREILGTDNFENLDLMKKELKKIEKNIMVVDDLSFLIDKFYLTNGNEIKELDNAVKNVKEILSEDLEDFFNFNQELTHLKYGGKFSIKTDEEMRDLCDKFDQFCNYFMGRKPNSILKKDYSEIICENMQKIIKEVINIKKDI